MTNRQNPASSIQTHVAPGDESDISPIRWVVCLLLFLATTINYMDRSVFSLIEPVLHTVPFMGWNSGADRFRQTVFDNNFGNIVISFQIAYGIGLLTAGRLIDRLGTRRGYALAILIWGVASMSHSLVTSVAGFFIARICLGLGEAGNFPAAIKATAEWFPTEERALATGLFNSGANFSYFVAPLLVAAVTERWGWRYAFVATGSMGMAWLVLWLLFPYNRLRRSSTTSTQARVALPPEKQSYLSLLSSRGAWAFAIGKGLTDGVWWFYLFYLPQFLNRNYGLELRAQYWFLVTVYLVSSVGSIFGGGLSGVLMKHGFSINAGRKLAMLTMAICVLPIIFVPHLGQVFPTNPWPATLLLALAAAAHQGWSANLFSTTGDMFPSTAVSTVVGFGGAMGAAGGAVFTTIIKHTLSMHPLFVFSLSSMVYLVALGIMHLLVPRLGARTATA
jgi:ACS family hexuronate transporter-like MFS transporter